MSNRHCHIHLICDSTDSTLYELQDALVMFFEDKAVITKDLFTTNAETANYSWRCVNACDWVIMLVGNSYGQLTNTGVSQLHISYLNAKTKNKPISVLVRPSEDRPRQLADLLAVINSQNQDIHQLQTTTALAPLLETLYQTHKPTPDTDEGKPTTTDWVLPEPTTIQKVAPHLHDEILLSCQAHAFRGGTLIEVGFMASTTWHQLLSALAQLATFSSQTLWKTLNELVSSQAMPTIQLSHPDVHAISRCQVGKADVLWLQEELHQVGWISKPNGGQKPAWQLTELARQMLPPASLKR